jgi:riboflavin biosynthesis pyrimidine reductase
MNELLDTYPDLYGVRLNMVVSGVGTFTDETGSSRGISNDLDRQLIGHLRRHSDVVVTGGNTARTEQYRVPSHCSLAVISKSFELVDDRYIRLTDPETAITKLNELGFERILLETGPSLSKYFLESGLVEEFCLTVTGGSLEVAAKTIASFNVELELVHAAELEGTLFTRWRRGNGE